MPVQLKNDDVTSLVNIIAEQADASLAGPERYFRDLVQRTNLEKRLKLQLAGGYAGDALIHARALINRTIANDVNPADSRYTTLGSLLEEVLKDVGTENYTRIVATIVAYRLYRDAALLAGLKTRYMVPELVTAAPQLPPEAADSQIGPEIDWRGPTELVELQRFTQPPPDMLDIGFLAQALAATASVCRIENPKKEPLGTGFLVAPGLVLTNYHVLSPEGEDLEAQARELVFRFGAITASDASEARGQVFSPRTEKPVVQASSVRKLDYVLLALEDTIRTANGLRPAKLELTSPTEGMGLHILQHPGGESMKLALSTNGVTGVYTETGLIQYLTSTRGGSSGSPCFNDEWGLVGLHHAERSRMFGTIREGILFRAIHSEISRYVQGP